MSGKPKQVPFAHSLPVLWTNPSTALQDGGVRANSFLVGTGQRGHAPQSLPSSLQAPLRILPLGISHPSTCLRGYTKIQYNKVQKNTFQSKFE